MELYTNYDLLIVKIPYSQNGGMDFLCVLKFKKYALFLTFRNQKNAIHQQKDIVRNQKWWCNKSRFKEKTVNLLCF